MRCLNAVTKSKTTIIRDLFFARDCDVNSDPESNMQHIIYHWSQSYENIQLTTSSKTEVMHQQHQEINMRIPQYKCTKLTLKRWEKPHHMKRLHRRTYITWQDTRVLSRTNLKSIYSILQRSKILCMARMLDAWLPKPFVYAELSSGKRSTES